LAVSQRHTLAHEHKLDDILQPILSSALALSCNRWRGIVPSVNPYPSDAAMVTLLAAARAMPRLIASLVSHRVKKGDVARSQKAVKMT
jgi:hypothetical protein